MGPAPAVATVRLAVRRALGGLGQRQPDLSGLVLVACSGGADSLALAAAAAFEGPPAGLRVGAVTVDHGLQPGSSARATAVAETLRAGGLDPVEVATIEVARVAGAGGPEAAARTARYAALEEASSRLGAAAVLLGHTRDDQAEGVLLGLARGSGARSLAGMPSRSGRYLRPLLDLGRDVTTAACAAEQLVPWSDPHNSDPAYARARVRQDALPVLERTLGPGVAEALARTARLLRDDADALDGWAEAAWRDCVDRAPADGAVDGGAVDGGLDVARLADLPSAVRRRVLRAAAVSAGCPAGALSAAHLHAVDALVTDWHQQAGVDLPGGVVGRRQCDRLLFTDRRTS